MKHRLILIFVLLGLPLGESALATTFYTSPSGSDSNAGTSQGAPWKTTAHAIPLLNPGDTLNLLNGTYPPIAVNCSSGAHNGTSGAPITVQALNERQALIQGNGLADTVSVNNCSFWNVLGLHVKAQDAVTANNVSLGNFANDNHLVLQRNIFDHTNRCSNNNAVIVGPSTTNSLISENELYYFHRWGILIWSGSTGNEIRQNYTNSRGYFQASNPTCTTYGGGSVGVGAYRGNGNTFENNIVENSANGLNAEATSSNNMYLGNVALSNTSVGFQANPHCSEDGTNGANNTWKQNVAVNNIGNGWWMLGTANAILDQNSEFGNGQPYGFRFDPIVSANVCGAQSWTVTNSTAQNNGTGYIVANAANATYSYDHNSNLNNSTTYSPSLHVINPILVNPAFGSCFLWAPDASPMHNAGLGGADIGANILYQYVAGSMTAVTLWASDGSPLFKGATVTGLNDVAGSSLFDIANRLNINKNGCIFPASYAGGVGLPNSPTGLTAVVN